MTAITYLKPSLIIFLLGFLSFSVHSQKAIRFGQPGSYLEVEDHASLRLPVMTLECWLKINQTGNPAFADGEQTLFDKRGNGGGFNLRLAGTRFPLPVFGFFDPEVQGHLPALINQKRWIHLAYVLSSDSVFIYLNGNRQTAVKKQGNYQENSGSALRIGEFLGYPGASLGLQGDMDELRIWNHVRSAAQIQADMHKTVQTSSGGLRLYLNFETISNQRILDQSGNGNHAKVQGNAMLIDSKAPIGYVPLPAPAGLRMIGATANILLEWEPVQGASAYRIYRSESPEFSTEDSPVFAAVGNTGTYTDVSAQTGKTYFYTVTAVDANGREGLAGAVAAARRILPEDYTTGVYYYPWYIPEENHHPWPEQYIRYFLKPAQAPLLGHYSVKNPETVKKHFHWMTASGIDFIVSSWWGPSSFEDLVLKNTLLQQLESSSLKFCVYYESAILGFGPNGIDISGNKENDLLDHFNYLEQTYFKSPAYLRIDNKPVVFLYLAGIYSGNYLQAFQKVRTAMASKGVSLFLIGDVDGWTQTDSVRLSFMDGISPYVTLGKTGYPVETNFPADVSMAHYHRQQELNNYNKLYIPNITPGFNNICVPCDKGFNWPRQISSTAPAESTLEYAIKAARPFIDPARKMILITSWNEWHEDSQIEPTVTAPPTSLDNSPGGMGYTRGYSYAGYGFRPLSLVAELLGNQKMVVPVNTIPAIAPGFNIYPSPARDKIVVEFYQALKKKTKIRITDLQGRTLSAAADPLNPVAEFKYVYSIQNLPPGLYTFYAEGYGSRKFIKVNQE